MKQTARKYTIKCKEEGCDSFYYARGLCRSHYKKLLGKEGGYIRDYARNKLKPGYMEMKRESDKKYSDRLRKEGVLGEKRHQYYLNIISDPNNVEKIHKRQKEYYKEVTSKNIEKTMAFSRRYRDEIKYKVLRHYSGDKLECSNCGIDVYSVLTLDHINNDGAEHKRRLSKSGKASSTTIYTDIIKHGFPEGYQVLCFNCNFHKEFMRKC